jgi:hypothetical protein
MAIQFNNGLTRAVNRLTEDNGNDVIQLTQDFASEPKLGMIIGKNNQYMMKNYSAKSIDGIQRVYCRQSNPMKDTTAGKMQLLEKYQAVPGVITSGAQITEVLETGQLDSSTEIDRNNRLAIDEENEAIVRGEKPPVMFTDNPIEHMKVHSRLFASPDDRKDPDLIERARIHYDEHVLVWSQTKPEILMALGIPPFPSAPPPGMPGMPPPPDGAPPPGGPAPNGPPPMDGPPVPGGPGMPTNPLTKEKWNPQTGGLPPQGA